jgi:hypothetical protein
MYFRVIVSVLVVAGFAAASALPELEKRYIADGAFCVKSTTCCSKSCIDSGFFLSNAITKSELTSLIDTC